MLLDLILGQRQARSGKELAEGLLEGFAEVFCGVVEDVVEVAEVRFVEHEDDALPAGDAGLGVDRVEDAAQAEGCVVVVVCRVKKVLGVGYRRFEVAGGLEGGEAAEIDG